MKKKPARDCRVSRLRIACCRTQAFFFRAFIDRAKSKSWVGSKSCTWYSRREEIQ